MMLQPTVSSLFARLTRMTLIAVAMFVGMTQLAPVTDVSAIAKATGIQVTVAQTAMAQDCPTQCITSHTGPDSNGELLFLIAFDHFWEDLVCPPGHTVNQSCLDYLRQLYEGKLSQAWADFIARTEICCNRECQNCCDWQQCHLDAQDDFLDAITKLMEEFNEHVGACCSANPFTEGMLPEEVELVEQIQAAEKAAGELVVGV